MKLKTLPIALCALLAACGGKSTEKEAPLPEAPKNDKATYRKELLAPTGKVVDFAVVQGSSKDFPGLKVKELSPGEGEETVGLGGSGIFKLRVGLASGKIVHKTSEELRLVSGCTIPGLIHGLVGMKKGARRQLTIPAKAAFGDRGYPMWQVPGRATLLVLAELEEVGAELDPGLEVRRVDEGKGEPMRFGEQGDVIYTGILAEGDKAGLQFDSNEATGQPFGMTSPPQQVIDGWKLGLVGMRAGESRWLKIPAHLAYGANGSAPHIPADAPLIFKVSLTRIHGR